MADTSSESIIMTLLEQVRCLEDERDKALALANSLNETLQKQGNATSTARRAPSSEQHYKKTLETLTNELEEIRLNEEQRQFNLSELSKAKKDKVEVTGGSDKMLELCKQYYGKMVADLQEERKTLQQKVEKLQNELIEKDMKIAELEINQMQAH